MNQQIPGWHGSVLCPWVSASQFRLYRYGTWSGSFKRRSSFRCCLFNFLLMKEEIPSLLFYFFVATYDLICCSRKILKPFTEFPDFDILKKRSFFIPRMTGTLIRRGKFNWSSMANLQYSYCQWALTPSL